MTSLLYQNNLVFIKQKNVLDKSRAILIFLLFLIFFSPVKLQIIKFILIAILFLIQVFHIRFDKIFINKKVFCWVSAYLVINLYFLIKGTYNNFGLFLQLLPSNFLYPLILFALIILNPDFRKINLFRLFTVFSIIISFYTLGMIGLYYLGLVTTNVPNIFGTEMNTDTGFLNYFSQNMTSYFILLPYIIARLIMYKKHKLGKKDFFLALVAIISSLISILITGRRALVLIIILAPIIFFVINNLKKPFKIFLFFLLSIIAVALLGLLLPYICDLFNLNKDKFGSIFNLLDIGDVRRQQMYALIRNWVDNYLLGAGFGVNANGSIRSDIPGSYELTYFAKLFSMGIFGFIFIVGFLIMILVKCLSFCKKYDKTEIIFPALVAFIALMIANFSNPYTGNFDYCWIIFLPLAYIVAPAEKTNENVKDKA